LPAPARDDKMARQPGFAKLDKTLGGDRAMRYDKKAIVDYDAVIALGPAKNWSRSPTPKSPQLVIERGQDPSVLVVAFTGFTGKLSVPTFDFLRSTELLNYNRILLCDHSRTCYMNGIPPVAEGLGALVKLLRQHIDQLAPKCTMFIGSSGGSHAAILFGHLLGADYVHAFSPHTNIDPGYWRESEVPKDVEAFGDALERLDRVPPSARAYFDLREVLRKSNGRTAYHLHACERSTPDMARALRLEGLPGVTMHRHDCDHHRVVVWLARQQRLVTLLKIENQSALTASAGG
jgi:hypothetical protein